MKKLSKLDESAWGEMRHRSSGKIIRKEDIIKSNEDLRNKIKGLYKEQGEGDALDVSSLSKLIACNDLSNLFYEFTNVKQIIGLETWDVSKVTNMNSMFCGCKSLIELNISNWDVSNVSSMGDMFKHCNSLTELNISNWDVSNVINMHSMFYGCSSLTELNISNWDVNATFIRNMFYECNKLIKPKWYKYE